MTTTTKNIETAVKFVHNATQETRTLTKYEDGSFSHDFDNNNISRYKDKSFYIYVIDDNGDKLQLATKHTPEVARLIDEFRQYNEHQKALEKAIKEQERKQAKETKTKSSDDVVLGFVYKGDEPIFDSVDKMLSYGDIEKIPTEILTLQQENELRQGRATKKLLLATYERDLQDAKELVAKCENALNERNAHLDKILETSQDDFNEMCLNVMTIHNNATLEKRKAKNHKE